MSGLASKLVIAFTITALSGAIFTAPTTATETSSVVVDDDHTQCPDADFETIQEAVDHAAMKNNDRNRQNIDLVRVCPGIYEEQVSVNTSVTISGVAESVSLDCFSPTQPILNPDSQAIVRAPSAATAPAVLFDLQADSIELQGLVLTGATGTDSRAITTSSSHSGYRVHHNLIVANTAGVYFRSNGDISSSFDHNCLRENGWGLANQFLPLVNARIHHNSTFRIANFAYEQTRNCPEFLETRTTETCSGSPIGMDDVVFDHNVSVHTSNFAVYRFAFSTNTTAYENTLTARFGMRLVGANEDLHIIDNRLDVQNGGLVRQSMPVVPSNFGVLIQGNTITRTTSASSTVPSAGIGMGTGGLKDSQIVDNVISGFTPGDPLLSGGINFNPGNTDNVVRGNTVTNSATGIWLAAGATDNTIDSNTMLDNELDARDDNVADENTWTNNTCVTDLPDGLCPGP